MLGEYYYHEIVKKTIIAFGTLFNNINIKHKKQDGSDYSTIKVPIAYGPVEKFTARLEQKPDLRNRVSIVLPRLAFEMTSIQYDNTRKVSTMQTFKALSSTDNQVVKKVLRIRILLIHYLLRLVLYKIYWILYQPQQQLLHPDFNRIN